MRALLLGGVGLLLLLKSLLVLSVVRMVLRLLVLLSWIELFVLLQAKLLLLLLLDLFVSLLDTIWQLPRVHLNMFIVFRCSVLLLLLL